MTGITTHVLDTSAGRPAAGVPVELHRLGDGGWVPLGAGATGEDGRLGGLLPEGLEAGTYRLRFDTGAYFRARGVEAFFPQVVVVFRVADPTEHHHVPLLLSPFGYATYRGS